MAYNVAGMLAQSGQNIGQAIGAPIEKFGVGLGNMMGARQQKQREQEEQKEVKNLLQKYAENPEQLNALGNNAAVEGNDELSKVFFKAAEQADQRRSNKVSALETAGQDIRKEAQRKRAVQVARQKGDQDALTALNARALDPVEYLKGLTGGKKDLVNVPAGGALVDPQTGEEVYRAPFKPETGTKKGIKTVKRDDESIVVFDDQSGEVIQTIPAPGKGTGDQESSLQLIQQTTQLLSDITDLKDIGVTESGFIGGVSSAIPGAPAYDREKQLLTLRANLGFEQINEMKRLAAESGASGTGLGQISNIEFMSLQSTIDAIYPGMTKDAQIEALENIEKHLTVIQKLASGVASADAIDWQRPEYKARGYHKDPETGTVFYAPDGRAGTIYKLVDGKFVKMGG